jgi:hypothetical protein
VPLVGGAQWVVGTAIALIAARRSRLYAGAGAAPRRVAWLALAIFLAAPIAVVTSLIAARNAGGAAVMPENATMAWRVQTVTMLSLAAWALVTIAAMWNGVLGVALRRRTAIQELKRRTDRVRDYRTPRRPPSP